MTYELELLTAVLLDELGVSSKGGAVPAPGALPRPGQHHRHHTHHERETTRQQLEPNRYGKALGKIALEKKMINVLVSIQ